MTFLSWMTGDWTTHCVTFTPLLILLPPSLSFLSLLPSSFSLPLPSLSFLLLPLLLPPSLSPIPPIRLSPSLPPLSFFSPFLLSPSLPPLSFLLLPPFPMPPSSLPSFLSLSSLSLPLFLPSPPSLQISCKVQ